MRRADVLSAFSPRADVNLEALAPAAWERLLLLDRVLAARGAKGTITSGKRASATPSQHTSGNAIDFVIPGDMPGLAQNLSSLGFTAQYETKGQRNPSGSVATGNHIHVTLTKGSPVAENPFSRAPAAPNPFSRAPVAENPFSRASAAPAPPNPFSRAAAPPAEPTVHPFQRMADAINPTTLLTSLYRGGVGAYNEAADAGAYAGREAASRGMNPFSMLGHAGRSFVHELPAIGAAGLRAMVNPKPPEPRVLRTMLGRTPENTNPNLYGALAVGDVLGSFFYDPTATVAGPLATGAAYRGAPGIKNVMTAIGESAPLQAAARASRTERGEAVTRAAGQMGVGRAFAAVRDSFKKHDLHLENRELSVGRIAKQMTATEDEIRKSPIYEASRQAYDQHFGHGYSPFQDLVKALFLQKAGFKGTSVTKEMPHLALPPAGFGRPKNPGILDTVPPAPPKGTASTGAEWAPREDFLKAFSEQWSVPYEAANHYADRLYKRYVSGIAFLQGTGARAPGAGVRTRYVGLGGKINFEKSAEVVAGRRERLVKRGASQFLDQVFGGEKPARLIGEPGSTSFAGRHIRLFGRAQLRDTINSLVAEGKYVKPVRVTVPGGPGLPGKATGKIDPAEKLGVSPGWEYVGRSNVWPKALWEKQVYKPVLDQLKARARAAGLDETKKARALSGPELGGPGALEDLTVKTGAFMGEQKRRIVNNPVTYLRSRAQNAAGAITGTALNGRPIKEFLGQYQSAVQEVLHERDMGIVSPAWQRLQARTRALAQTRASTISPSGARSAREVAGVTGRMVYPGTGRKGPASLLANVRGEAVRVPEGAEVMRRVKRAFIDPNELHDRAAKLALFKTLEPHIGPDRAAKEVEKWLFDPTNRGAFFVAMDQMGVLPFNAYMLKGAEAAARLSLTRPDIPARVGLLAPQMAQAVGAGDRLKNAPEYRKSPMLLPISKDLAIDVLSFTNIRDLMDVGQIVGSLTGNPADTAIEHSLFRPLVEIATNRQLLGDEERELIRQGTSPRRTIAGRTMHGFYSLTPGIVRNTVKFGESLAGQPQPGALGEVEKPLHAAIRAYLGIPIVSLKPPEERGGPGVEQKLIARGMHTQRYLDAVVRSAGYPDLETYGTKEYAEKRALATERNRYRGEAKRISDPRALSGKLQAAAKELSRASADAQNYHGTQLSAKGKLILRDQLAYVYALEDRLMEIAPLPAE